MRLRGRFMAGTKQPRPELKQMESRDRKESRRLEGVQGLGTEGGSEELAEHRAINQGLVQRG